MKKIITLTLSLLMIFALCVPLASAASINENEKEVMDLLGTKEVIKGKTYAFPQNYINMAENYFLHIDMTTEQKDEVVPYLNHSYDILKSYRSQLNGTNELFAVVSAEDKNACLQDAIKAAEVIGLTITTSYDSSSHSIILKAVDADGKVWLNNAAVVKITGASSSMVSILTLSAFALMGIGATAVFVKKRKVR